MGRRFLTFDESGDGTGAPTATYTVPVGKRAKVLLSEIILTSFASTAYAYIGPNYKLNGGNANITMNKVIYWRQTAAESDGGACGGGCWGALALSESMISLTRERVISFNVNSGDTYTTFGLELVPVGTPGNFFALGEVLLNEGEEIIFANVEYTFKARVIEEDN